MFAQTCPGMPILDQIGTFNIRTEECVRFFFYLKSVQQNVLHILAITACLWKSASEDILNTTLSQSDCTVNQILISYEPLRYLSTYFLWWWTLMRRNHKYISWCHMPDQTCPGMPILCEIALSSILLEFFSEKLKMGMSILLFFHLPLTLYITFHRKLSS